MDMKLKFVCSICQKAFTKNSSLKRHRTNQHMGVIFNCLTCNKQYKRREDLVRHSKKCLSKELEDSSENSAPNNPSTSSLPPTGNPPSEAITNLHMDLTLSDSDSDNDIEITKTAKTLENQLLSSKMSRETNTEISSLLTVDKSTNTEPLIILSPDEVIDLQDGLTLLSYDKNIRIFVDTVSSNIVYCKPKLNKPDNPSTQIGILNMIPAFNKGSQTKISTTSHIAVSNHLPNTVIPTKVSPNATDQIVSNMGCATPKVGNDSNPTNDPQIGKVCPTLATQLQVQAVN